MATKAPAKRTAGKKAAPKPAKKARPASKTDLRKQRFVDEYLIDLNGTQAAIRAGYSPAGARFTASELLTLPDVQAKLDEAMAARAERTGISADNVLARLWGIASADPRELIELHRACCRFCWGKGHRYQYTPNELEEAKREHAEKAEQARAARMKAPPPFSAPGGIGYNPRKDPNTDCPECFGEGVERVVAKDTRDLSPTARLLYAGVKTTQHGLEIKMHDQRGAAVDIGRHLGLFKERMELTGKDGKPIQTNQTYGELLEELDGAGTGLPDHARSQ